MRNGWSGVGWSEKEVNLCIIFPPVMPPGFVRLSFRHPPPLLERGFLMPILQQSGPDLVSTDIFDPEVVQILDRTRDLHIKVHLRRAFVTPLTSPEERTESLAAVGVKEG